ncbi:hypothetical protein JW968_05750 [Candidatus Woesearchaeota archaeon]|nr:hypothetical protein [Candidatus Woesearchaeota archaeon]
MNAPVYVRVEEYRDVLDAMNIIKAKINKAKATLAKLNELKNKEDNELAYWKNALDDVDKKVVYIDKSLFEPETV